jgi:hypothetical protein
MTTIKDFKTCDGKHCETTATKCLLLHEEIDMTEPMLLGISQGFGFIYWKMKFMNLPFIGGRSKPFDLTRIFCQNIGLEVDERQTTSKKKAWSNITDFIDRGIPVGLQLDCYHLEHFNHSFHFAGHFIAVYGYDDNYAYVFDTGKKYKVSLDNLEKARFEKGSMAAKARSYTLKKNKDISSVKPLIPASLNEIAKGFLHPPLKSFGYFGVIKLAREMVKWIDDSPNPPKDLNDQAELMENGGTGGAIFRNFFRDFLYECLTYYPDNNSIKTGAGLYKQAANNWTEIANLIRKAGDSQERKYLETASSICFQTAEIEKEAMGNLLSI